MLLQDSRIGRDFSRDSTARSQYFERIRDTDAQLVFIVDEVDVLDDDEARASSQKSRSTRRRDLDSPERYGLITQKRMTRGTTYEPAEP
jgi:hypothetical protein